MPENDARWLLLSVRPRFADAILSGDKVFELRRTLPTVEEGVPCLLYASSPRMAIVGSARVASIQTGSPARIWRLAQQGGGVTRDEYESYFAGAERAVALHLDQPVRFREPIALAVLRATYGFQPPQSFRYVGADDPLRSLLPTAMIEPLAHAKDERAGWWGRVLDAVKAVRTGFKAPATPSTAGDELTEIAHATELAAN